MAIISNAHSFIFVHVPKAAGTSLSDYYSQTNTIIDVEIGGTTLGEALQAKYQERYSVGKHVPALRLRTLLGEDTYRRFRVFAFVRNPFFRTVSTFNFLKKWLPDSEAKADANIFAEFDNVTDMLESAYWETSGWDEIFLPQTHWVCDEQGQLIVDFIGKVENLVHDVRHLNSRLGMALPDIDVRLNASDTFSQVDEIPQRGLDRILERYADDFEQFGYSRRLD